ncbi:MAG: aspartate dehydrogenase [Candidatus Hydrothermarchaeota archaeon]
MRIGILGCGAIGSYVAKRLANKASLYLFDRNFDKSETLAKETGARAVKFDELVEEELDIVIEAASQKAVKELAPIILQKHDLLVCSTGALMDSDLFNKLKKISEKSNTKILIPSGAMVGIDGLNAIKDGVESVSLITRKPAKHFGLEKETIIFEGNVEEAVKRFPKEINIAATISLALDKKIKVKIIVDPNIEKNIHSLRAMGNFGEIEIKVESNPLKENPKTSELAPLSVVATIEKMISKVKIGT